MPNSRYGLVIS